MDYAESYSMIANIVSILIRLAIWGVVGYIMGKKAKDVGLSFGTYFALTFLLGVIGLVISIVKINNQKKNIALMQMQQNGYGHPYGQNPYQQQPQNPYQNNAANPYGAQQQQNTYSGAYQQQGYNQTQQAGQQGYQQSAYQQSTPQQNVYTQPYTNQNPAQNFNNANGSGFGINFTCKECGNVQNTPGFCKVCGAKL